MRRLLQRDLAIMILVVTVTACTEDSTNPGDLTPMPQGRANAAAINAAAIYGLNAQLSYPGKPNSLAEEAMVYVFLRKSGTRMPLLLRHFPASELPKRVSFTAATQDEGFELVARLSLSGRVDRSPEDIEIVQAVAGFRHPPQNYAMVLGAVTESVSPDSAEANGVVASAAAEEVGETRSVTIRAAVAIENSHPFPVDTVVFVIAREPGQPMPSVVKRLSLADLPTRIELTDADAMTFSSRISHTERLDLFARVSTSGTATQSNADWVSDTVHLETARLPELVTLTLSP